MEVVNYFGPPLVKLQADNAILARLNNYADQILAKEEVKAKLDLTERLAYAVAGGYTVKKNFLHDLDDYLIAQGLEFLKRFASPNEQGCQLAINGMWIVSQTRGMWGNLHKHTGDISGIIYLKMPREKREGFSEKHANLLVPGGISFVQGYPGIFHRSDITLEPEVGEMYLFPSTLSHVVYPFSGPEERRSFSFNLHILQKT